MASHDYRSIEKKLSALNYQNSGADFNSVWNNYDVSLQEAKMAKKGSAKVIIGIVLFLAVVGGGFFGMMRASAAERVASLEEGSTMLVTMVIGEVDVMPENATDWRPLKVNEVLQMGDSVRTGEDAKCELQMIGRGIFRLESSTELALSLLEVGEDGGVDVRMGLEEGEIALKPEELAENDTFEVETSTAVAAVRGTKFSVSTSESGDIVVAVVEGAVAVSPNLRSIDNAVSAGQMTAEAAEIMKESLVDEVSVTPGQEINLTKAEVEAVDNAIAEVVTEVVATRGIITEEVLKPSSADETAEAEVTESFSLVMDIRTQAAEKVEATSDEGTSSLFNIQSKVQEISEEAAQKLDQLSEEAIIDNFEQLVYIEYKTTPAGADLYLDGVKVGQTPYTIIAEKGSVLPVMVMADGFDNFSETLEVTASKKFSVSRTLTAVAVAEPETPELVENETEEIEELMETAEAEETEVAVAEVEESTPVATTPPRPSNGDVKSTDTVSFLSEVKMPAYSGTTAIASSGTSLYFVNLETGNIKTVDVPASGDLTPATVGNGYVYVSSDGGGTWCYSTSGSLIWSSTEGKGNNFDVDLPSAGSGLVAVLSDTGLVILDGYSGSVKARVVDSGSIYATPAIVNGGETIVYANSLGEVVAVNSSGTELWRTQAFDTRVALPVVGKDGVVAAMETKTGEIKGFDPSDGTELWATGALSALAGTEYVPVRKGSFVTYVSRSGKSAYCLQLNDSAGDNEPWWLFSTDTEMLSPRFAEGWVLSGTAEGEFVAYELSTGSSWDAYVSGGVTLVGVSSDSAYALGASKLTTFYNE